MLAIAGGIVIALLVLIFLKEIGQTIGAIILLAVGCLVLWGLAQLISSGYALVSSETRARLGTLAPWVIGTCALLVWGVSLARAIRQAMDLIRKPIEDVEMRWVLRCFIISIFMPFALSGLEGPDPLNEPLSIRFAVLAPIALSLALVLLAAVLGGVQLIRRRLPHS